MITNISIFLSIADSKIDGQNNESEVEVNAIGYPVQNTALIGKLIYRYYKLSVCLCVDTKILVRDILADFLSIFYVNRVKSGVRHCLTILIIYIGHCMSCGIAFDGGSMCEICSQPSTSADASTAQNETANGMYY